MLSNSGKEGGELVPLTKLDAPQLVVNVRATGDAAPQNIGFAMNRLRYAAERIAVPLSPQLEIVWLAQRGLWGDGFRWNRHPRLGIAW